MNFLKFAILLTLLYTYYSQDCTNDDDTISIKYNAQRLRYLPLDGYNGDQGWETYDDASQLGFASNYNDVDITDTEFTFNTLLKVSLSQEGKTIIHFKSASGNEEFQVSIDDSNKLVIRVKTVNVDQSFTTITTTIINDWQFISISVGFNSLKVYNNGTLQDEFTHDFQGLFTEIFELYAFGAYYQPTTNDPSNILNSVISKINFYNKLFSDNEISQCFYQDDILTQSSEEEECDYLEEQGIEFDIGTVQPQEGTGPFLRTQYYFDGQSTSFGLGQEKLFINYHDFSILLTQKIDAGDLQGGASMVYFATDNSASPNEFVHIRHALTDKKIEIIIKINGGAEQTYTSTNEVLVYDQWQVLGFSFSDQFIFLYVDGQLVDQFFHDYQFFHGILGHQTLGKYLDETPLKFGISFFELYYDGLYYPTYKCFFDEQNSGCYDLEDIFEIHFEYRDVQWREDEGFDGQTGLYFDSQDNSHLIKDQNNNYEINLTDRDFTLSFFVKVDNDQDFQQTFLFFSQTKENQDQSLIIQQAPASGAIQIVYSGQGAPQTFQSNNSGLIVSGEWKHVTVILKETQIQLFVDGVIEGDFTHSSGYFTEQFDFVTVGAYYYTSGDIQNKFSGFISQLYMYEYSINVQQSLCLAAGYKPQEHEEEELDCESLDDMEDKLRVEILYRIQNLVYSPQDGYNGSVGWKTYQNNSELGFASSFNHIDLTKDEFTFYTLLKVDLNQQGKTITHLKSASGEEEFQVSIDDNNKLVIRIKTVNVDLSYTTTNATIGTDWQFTAIAVGDGYIKVYIDGDFQDGFSDNFQGLYTQTFKYYAFGAYYQPTSNEPTNFLSSTISRIEFKRKNIFR